MEETRAAAPYGISVFVSQNNSVVIESVGIKIALYAGSKDYDACECACGNPGVRSYITALE